LLQRARRGVPRLRSPLQPLDSAFPPKPALEWLPTAGATPRDIGKGSSAKIPETTMPEAPRSEAAHFTVFRSAREELATKTTFPLPRTPEEASFDGRIEGEAIYFGRRARQEWSASLKGR